MTSFVLAQAAGDSLQFATVVLSAVALATAFGATILTFIQGQAIKNIETREHEWQAEDRKTAHVEVVRIHQAEMFDASGGLLKKSDDWVRMTNSGRAPAKAVTWTGEVLEHAPDTLRFADTPDGLDVIYPGEHFDLRLYPRPPDKLASFTVNWIDGNGPHSTTRLLSL